MLEKMSVQQLLELYSDSYLNLLGQGSALAEEHMPVYAELLKTDAVASSRYLRNQIIEEIKVRINDSGNRKISLTWNQAN